MSSAVSRTHAHQPDMATRRPAPNLSDVARHDAAPLSTVNVWCTVQGYADQVGLSHIKPHDFRRFVGTQLAKRDSRAAQKALGHTRIDTTAQHYVLDELEEGLTDDVY